MKKFLTLSLLIALFSLPSYGSDQPAIQVTGTAELEIVPDQIFVSVTLKEFMKEKKKHELEDLEKGLVNYLQTVVKVDQKDIRMENLDARVIAMKRKSNKEEYLTKSYEVKVKNFAQVKEIFVVMDSLGISRAFIARYNHSKMDEYKKQIKINAIKAAREKADYLMAAIGQKAGKAISVKENNQGLVSMDGDLERRPYRGNYYSNSISQSFDFLGGSSDSSSNGELDLGEKTIKLYYSIDVDFLIE